MMAACTGAIDYVGPTTYIAFVKLLQRQDAVNVFPRAQGRAPYRHCP